MSSWRSGRGLQWQPVKLWWTPCSRGLRQWWKIMVATQNIDTLGSIWTFSLRGVLHFVASGLDINGCVLSYFEGRANLHCYTSCTLTTLHCSKVSFLQCCHMKRYNKIFTKMWGVYSLLWDTVSISSPKEETHYHCKYSVLLCCHKTFKQEVTVEIMTLHHCCHTTLTAIKWRQDCNVATRKPTVRIITSSYKMVNWKLSIININLKM